MGATYTRQSSYSDGDTITVKLIPMMSLISY